ncbi:uncharacterized protein Tco025E_08783 [Trypanosoma conorhini]|uniref:Uncharacterized protein n=1 Tax=Trypanosoma conorhini TaxID=83891 RepID=A0A422N4W0_9TRYP|nr:uncharacterized protein Tco025E_08783 [Trypanosoma conorhini]RNF00494.1 hypothetical protein Tco025E_08783 [Trypanosoma conorhini]
MVTRDPCGRPTTTTNTCKGVEEGADALLRSRRTRSVDKGFDAPCALQTSKPVPCAPYTLGMEVPALVPFSLWMRHTDVVMFFGPALVPTANACIEGMNSVVVKVFIFLFFGGGVLFLSVVRRNLAAARQKGFLCGGNVDGGSA